MQKKSPSAKSIIDNINKIKVIFNIDSPEQGIKEGDILEFVESEAKKLVKNGIGKFYDKEKQEEYEEEDTIKYLASTYMDKKEMAHNFIKLQPIFYDRACLFWLWDKKKKLWNIVDETDLLNKIDRALPMNIDSIQSKHKQEILESLKRVGRENIPEPMKKTWIQFNDKIVDIMTGELMEADPKYHITNPIPWEIGETDETPVIDRIFEEWVGKENVKTLYQIISYCLLPDYPIHRLFCLVGAGLNGKSKFLELIVKFVGKDNSTNTELDTLLNSRFEVSKIFKKLVCVMGETDYSNIQKTSLLKRLTGQDQIGFEFKNKNPFDDYNYAKILISTNSLPITEDKTIGFYRRWLILSFNNKFSEKKDILTDIPEQEYRNLAKKSIKILKELLEKREFNNEGTIEERTKKYEDTSDPLQKFLKETTIISLDSSIPKFEFRDRFFDWLISNGYRKWNETFLGLQMKDKGFDTGRVSKPDGDGQWRAWMGLKWAKTAKLWLKWEKRNRQQETLPSQGSQGCHTNPTQIPIEGVSRDTLTTLTTLTKWKESGDGKLAVSEGLLKNAYGLKDEEIKDLLKKGLIFCPSPGKYKIV